MVGLYEYHLSVTHTCVASIPKEVNSTMPTTTRVPFLRTTVALTITATTMVVADYCQSHCCSHQGTLVVVGVVGFASVRMKATRISQRAFGDAKGIYTRAVVSALDWFKIVTFTLPREGECNNQQNLQVSNLSCVKSVLQRQGFEKTSDAKFCCDPTRGCTATLACL